MIPERNQTLELYLEHVNRYLFSAQFVNGKTVLDIACGTGYGSELLQQAGAQQVYGVDISAESIEYANEKFGNPQITFKVGSVDRIPLEDHSVDIVVSMETIEHVDSATQKKFLQEVKRVLRNPGMFLVSTPNPPIYPAGNPYHIKELTTDELQHLVHGYFSHVNLFYQDNVESNFIVSSPQLEKEFLLKESDRLALRKINTIDPKDSMYTIAVCSTKELKRPIQEYVAMFNMKPRVIYSWCENVGKEKEHLEQELGASKKETEGLKTTLLTAQEQSQKKQEQLQQQLQQQLATSAAELEQQRMEAQNREQQMEQSRLRQQKQIQSLDTVVQKQKQQLALSAESIQEKDRTLLWMQNSKFWKLRSLYERLRHPLSRSS